MQGRPMRCQGGALSPRCTGKNDGRILAREGKFRSTGLCNDRSKAVRAEEGDCRAIRSASGEIPRHYSGRMF